MTTALFYHLYLADRWEPVAAEYTQALSDAGVPGDLTVGLVCDDAVRRHAAKAWWRRNCGGRPIRFTEADAGWEQVTLQALWGRAQRLPASAVISYAHAKGVVHAGAGKAVWRQSMTRHLLCQWRESMPMLAGGVQVTGCHWLTPYDGAHGSIFGGNYWWATAGYIAGLPAPSSDLSDRHAAERWIGLGNPHIYDLRPGWPYPNLFTQAERDAAERAEAMRWEGVTNEPR